MLLDWHIILKFHDVGSITEYGINFRMECSTQMGRCVVHTDVNKDNLVFISYEEFLYVFENIDQFMACRL